MLVSGIIHKKSPEAIKKTKIATYPTMELKKECISLKKILRIGYEGNFSEKANLRNFHGKTTAHL